MLSNYMNLKNKLNNDLQILMFAESNLYKEAVNLAVGYMMDDVDSDIYKPEHMMLRIDKHKNEVVLQYAFDNVMFEMKESLAVWMELLSAEYELFGH